MRRQRENRITQLELFSVGRMAWGSPITSEPAHDGVGALDAVKGSFFADPTSAPPGFAEFSQTHADPVRIRAEQTHSPRFR
jgi:hypothetical protein